MREGSAKRKTHTKSRKGCLQCKKRHTKCNEAHPRCANCIRLDIQCTWISQSNGLPVSSRPESRVSTQMQHQDEHKASLSKLSLEDMRLLHHWTIKTSKAQDPGYVSQNLLWGVEVVEIGFDYPFLLHGMLALAAVHKTIYDPQLQRGPLLQQADSHMTIALETYRMNLEHPTLDSALPMFVMSSILVQYNLASASLEEPEEPIDALSHCFRLLQGVMVVIQPHWSQLSETSVFSRMASAAMDPKLEPTPGDGEIREISQLKDLTADLAEPDKDACIQAINELHRAFIRVRKCSDQAGQHSVIMGWPASMTDQFMKLISSYHPVAAILLSYFAILMHRMQRIWWLHGWPTRIMKASRRVLAMFPELLKWLDWPSQQIEIANGGAESLQRPTRQAVSTGDSISHDGLA